MTWQMRDRASLAAGDAAELRTSQGATWPPVSQVERARQARVEAGKNAKQRPDTASISSFVGWGVLFLQHLFRNAALRALPYRHPKCTVEDHARWFFCDRGGHPESSRQAFAHLARAQAGIQPSLYCHIMGVWSNRTTRDAYRTTGGCIQSLQTLPIGGCG